MAISSDQITKVREYLLANGQQELAGHLDGMEQELNELRNSTSENPREFADGSDRMSAQDFQDQYKPNNDESES